MSEDKKLQVPEMMDTDNKVIDNPPKGSFWSRNGAKIITGVISLSLVVFIIIMITGIGNVGSKAADQGYKKAKEKSREEEYQNAYQVAYEWSEAAHHTSNNAHISIEKLQEKSELEVLTVTYDDIETTNDSVSNVVSDFLDSLKDLIYQDKISLWQKFTFKGAYTVNLEQAEYIIDNARGYVLVRLPQPQITKVDIVTSEQLYTGDGGLFNTTKEGVDLNAQQRADAQEKTLKALQEHEVYVNAAKDSAEQFIISFIKELNPEVENIIIDVEFVE